MELREQKEVLQGLLSSPGWDLLREVLEEQIAHRTQAIILSPLESVDRLGVQEYAKGEVAALKLALQMPEAMLEAVVDELKQLEEELKNDPKS